MMHPTETVQFLEAPRRSPPRRISMFLLRKVKIVGSDDIYSLAQFPHPQKTTYRHTLEGNHSCMILPRDLFSQLHLQPHLTNVSNEPQVFTLKH